MTEDEALIAAIAENPRELTIQLALADYYAEREDSREQAWRWIAAFRRRPSPFKLIRLDREPYWTAVRTNLLPGELLAGYGWGNWDWEGLNWPWSAGLSMISPPLFRWLPKRGTILDTGRGSERGYETITAAFQSLADAFVRATRPRASALDRLWNGASWAPEWDLVSEVPNE